MDDPPGGTIDRDERGEPTGVLRESAQNLVRQIIPPPTLQQSKAALIDNLALLFEQKQIRIPRPELWPEGVEELESDAGGLEERTRRRLSGEDGIHGGGYEDGLTGRYPLVLAAQRRVLSTMVISLSLTFLAVAAIYSLFKGSLWERVFFLPITLFGALLAGWLTFG